MTAVPLTGEELQAIRDTDAAAGCSMAFAPLAWEQRRALLAHIAALEEVQASHDTLVRQLDVLINGEENAAMLPSLCDIVAQLTRMQGPPPDYLANVIDPRAVAQMMPPIVLLPTCCGYCSYEEADGSLIEQCAKCKTADGAA